MAKWTTTAMAIILLAACGPAPAQTGGAEAAAVAENAVFVDVRTDEEWAAGHIEGALHIPLQELEQRWQELEPYRDREIVLYCRTGRRSGIALSALQDRGFTLLRNGGSLEQAAAHGRAIRR
jgi:rhodanese-related sulfurtransferase